MQRGLFLSPLSLAVALGIALRGTGPGSLSQHELLEYFGDGTQEENLIDEMSTCLQAMLGQDATLNGSVVLANSMWLKRIALNQRYADGIACKFLVRYQDCPSLRFGKCVCGQVQLLKHAMLYLGPFLVLTVQAKVQEVSSAAPINDWCRAATNGLISELVPPDLDFAAIIANAMYFKADWECPFNCNNTMQQDFTNFAGMKKRVDMMVDWARPVLRMKVIEGLCTSVRLDFKGGAFYAVASLPAEEVALSAVLARAQELMDGPQSSGWQDMRKVFLALPKFSFANQYSLVDDLKHLGVQAVFSQEADFSRMTHSPAHLSEVLHKVVVHINEEGVEAAAGTAIYVSLSAPVVTTSVVFNRPFLFSIIHRETQSALIAGIVLDP